MNSQQRRVVDATLANDEASTDEELFDYFVHEVGVTTEEATVAIQKRTEALKQI